MSLRLRSSSVGSRPRPRLHRSSRAESAAALALDVRCACQYYETNSLLPERVNPVGYNAGQEFEPCIHVHARLKEHERRQQQQQQQSGSDSAFIPTITNAPHQQQTNVSAQNAAAPRHSKTYDLPPEFAPENLYIDTAMVKRKISGHDDEYGNRSASCANMDTTMSTPQFIKQRDPSTSSLLRKRMSEERQSYSVLNKRASGSTTSRDRFSAQKDPSESTILRRKMSNRSSGSFERANSELVSTERIQQSSFQFQSSRIPNERTFYHDSNEFIRNSSMNVGDVTTESPFSALPAAAVLSSPPQQIGVASPLSMQAQGNRRFVLSSTENLPLHQIDAYMKTSVETEPDSGIDSNYVDEPQRNVSDEEKVQILLSKSNTLSASEKIDTPSAKVKPAAAAAAATKQKLQKLQLMSVEDVQMEMPVQTPIQYKYLPKADNMMRLQEAETADYSYSKLFDNYKSPERTASVPISNISSPDLRTNYVKQRDPSQSPLVKSRHKTKVPEADEAAPPSSSAIIPIPNEMKTTIHDRLLPSAGELPERRASDVFRPHPNQESGPPSFIRQKDLRTSNVLNRRRRNLSQSSLGQDHEMGDASGHQTKVTKTISFEKNLSQIESDQISYTDTSVKITKGVSFEYNRPMASDRSEPNAFDTSQLSANKRPSRDHEYEPIGEPSEASTTEQHALERPIVKISEPEVSAVVDVANVESANANETNEIDDHTGTESPMRSITPFTDISRTEDLHTSQVDDSVIEELPLRREDRKKKSFMTNAGEHTKNLQNKISSQASSLRTKFKRSLKPSGRSAASGDGSGGSGQKASGPNLKTSLKSSPKTAQTSPRERKKFKRIDFANKLKLSKLKFKRSRTESGQSDATADEVPGSELGTDEPGTVVSVKTEEIFETKTMPSKKLFEFGSYPKIFSRFNKTQAKSDGHDVTDDVSNEPDTDRDTQPSSSSFSTHFATVPRTATKIKKSIISKWNKSNFARSTDHADSESIPHESHTPHDDLEREDSVERRIRLASKISMEDEEEPLGILQTKEQIQLASYNEENRAIHEISRAREQEFRARKPLTHQDSDLVSEESNRDIDWEEVERMRAKIMGSQQTPSYIESTTTKKQIIHGRRPRTDSNFSTEETQSSGSSGDRRRTGVIEDIDDDEFFLRQRGVSQDNAEISQYISSAIREGMNDPAGGRQFSSYSYDHNEVFADDYPHFDEPPRKPMRHRRHNFDTSYDDYPHQHDDHEPPVDTQYYPRHDDENISFYDNDFTDDIDQTNILSRDPQFDSDVDNEVIHAVDAKPEAPKRRQKVPAKQDSVEANEEVFISQSEPPNAPIITKPARKNRAKSDTPKVDRASSVEPESTTIERYSPSNSRFTINIKETNGYATVKKEPPARPPAPARRRQRSSKSLGHVFKDSPFPERQARGVIAPTRPPRRGSSSSLIDTHKPPSVAPSDGTQYEEIDDDDDLDDEDNAFFKMQNRPLPPPPRPPRDRRRRRRTVSSSDKKFDDNDDNVGLMVASFDDAESEFSTREFVGTEMATQTSLDIDDLYLNDDMPINTEQYTRTVEEILQTTANDGSMQRSGGGSSRTSDDNLSRGLAKFRESNQRLYSERCSRASTDRQSSRPITPSALVIEQRIARSPIQTDATLIMQPVEDASNLEFRTDSAESEYVPYADDVDDTQIDTEDERIINAAIRRYQMLGNELSDDRASSPRSTTPKVTKDIETARNVESAADQNQNEVIDELLTPPLPPPRRKSSANAAQIVETINVPPLAEQETVSVASTQDLNRITSEPVNDLSSESVQPEQATVESLTVINIQTTNAEPQDATIRTSPLRITSETGQEISETLQAADTAPSENVTEHAKTENKAATTKPTSEEPPKRPPSPVDYTPTSEIPPSFYRLRTGISDDESVPSIPPTNLPKLRPPPRAKRDARQPESSSDDECNRRHHHHHTHHGAVATTSRAQDLSIVDLSGLLIRACGRAISSSLSTAGHSVIDFIRSLAKNHDDQHHQDLSLVLIILIVIVATLMMLGISGDRPIHHHHHHFLNPPDHFGRQ